jgi:hypothetical protein
LFQNCFACPKNGFLHGRVKRYGLIDSEAAADVFARGLGV